MDSCQSEREKSWEIFVVEFIVKAKFWPSADSHVFFLLFMSEHRKHLGNTVRDQERSIVQNKQIDFEFSLLTVFLNFVFFFLFDARIAT